MMKDKYKFDFFVYLIGLFLFFEINKFINSNFWQEQILSNIFKSNYIQILR